VLLFFPELFDFLRGFVDLGDPERRLVIQSDMLQRLVEFYIGEYEATTNGITQLYNAVWLKFLCYDG
jgi:hypothetical protein